MNRPKLSDIKKNIAAAVGFVPSEICVGERQAAHDPSKYSCNSLEWAEDADLNDAVTLDVDLLKSLNYARGVMLDLYIYEPATGDDSCADLATNVTVVIASDYEVLAAYDSVGHTGMTYDNWWCGR